MKPSSSEYRDRSQKENVSTPIKMRDISRIEDNFSGGKDTAFQLYCKQNLSPINFYPLLGISNRSPYISTPDVTKNQQSASGKKSKFKSLFSPSDISATFPSLENEKFISPKIKTIENDQSDEGIKSKHNEIAKNASKNQGSKLVQLVLLNGDTEKKDNDPNNELQSYDYSSPSFNNQLEKFFESDIKREINEDFGFSSSNANNNINKNNNTNNSKQQQQLQQKQEQESYKRVIEFQDDQEEIQEGFPINQIGFYSNENFDNGFPREEILSNFNNIKQSGDRLVSKQINLFQQSNKGQSHPEGAFPEANATTAKKPEENISLPQPTKQKRKLFDSPQSSSNKDLQTPSTKKKAVTLQRSNITIIKVPINAVSPQNKDNNKDHQIVLEKIDNQRKETQEVQEEEQEEEEEEVEEEEDEDEEEDDEMEIDDYQEGESSEKYVYKKIMHEEKKICCNCKRTKCLKLYCECFAASKVCEGCTCQGCFNRPEFESIRQEARNSILERNNSAFDPKIDNLCEDGIEDNEYKAHSKGCNCKKSNCLKKYCECYQLGVKCTKLCKCDHCKNITNSAGCFEEDLHATNPTSTNKIGIKDSKLIGVNGKNEYGMNYFYNHPEQYYQYYYSQYGCYPYYGDYYQYGTEEYNEGEIPLQYSQDMQPPFNTYHPNNMKKKSSKNKRKIQSDEEENRNDLKQEKGDKIGPPPIEKKQKSSKAEDERDIQSEKNSPTNKRIKEGIEDEEQCQQETSSHKKEKSNKKNEYKNKQKDISAPISTIISKPIIIHHNLNTRSSQRLSEGKNVIQENLLDKPNTITLQFDYKHKPINEMKKEEKRDLTFSSKKVCSKKR